MESIHTLKLKHVTGHIHYDTDPLNPRTEYDNRCVIALTDNRYLTGDEKLTPELIDDIKSDPNIEYRMIYAYIHSGIVLSFSPFSCPFDSGMIGIIYTDKETIQKEFTEDPENWKKNAFGCIQAEFSTYKAFIENECYGIEVIDNYTQESLDSCWGFLGDIAYVESELKELAEYHNKEYEKLSDSIVNN